MGESHRPQRLRLETDLVDLEYRMAEARVKTWVGEKRYRVAVVEFRLKKPVLSSTLVRELVALFKTFIGELVPEHEVTVVAGNAPAWLYSILALELAHATKVLAFPNPEAEGAVLVSVHYWDMPLEPGDIIKLDVEETKKPTQ